MLEIWSASIEPSSAKKPAETMTTPRKTRPVARPRRMPRAAIRSTAGSTASARKNAIRMFSSNPMSW